MVTTSDNTKTATRTACAYAVFFFHVRLQEGVTASVAARAGAVVGARAEELAAGNRAAAVYGTCVPVRLFTFFLNLSQLFPSCKMSIFLHGLTAHM
jgi:hypothetical protein